MTTLALGLCPLGNVSALSEQGAIKVTLSMTGPLTDTDGVTVSIAADKERRILNGKTTTFGYLAEGSYEVVLSGLPAHCTTAAGERRPVAVRAGETTEVGFDAVCTRPGQPTLLFDRAALAVPLGGTETIAITAMTADGRADEWGGHSADEGIATRETRRSSIDVRGVRPGATQLVVKTRSGIERRVPVTVYDPFVLETEELLVRYVTEFDFLSGARLPAGFPGPKDGIAWFHPRVDSGNGWRALGSLAREGDLREQIDGEAWAIAVKASPRANRLRPPLADPTGFTLEFASEWRVTRKGTFSLWTPVCPAAYVAMGSVARFTPLGDRSKKEPGPELVTCVREDLTVAATAGPPFPAWFWSSGSVGPYAHYVSTDVEGETEPRSGRTPIEAGTPVVFGPSGRHLDYDFDGRSLRDKPLPAIKKMRDDVSSWHRKARDVISLTGLPFRKKKTMDRLWVYSQCRRHGDLRREQGVLTDEAVEELWLCTMKQTTDVVAHPGLHVLAVELPMLIDREERRRAPVLSSLESPPETGEPVLEKVMLVPVTTLGGAFQDELWGPTGYLARSPFVRLERRARFRKADDVVCIGAPACERALRVKTEETVSESVSETLSEAVGRSVTNELSVGVELGKKDAPARVQGGYKRTATVTVTESWSRGLAQSIARSEGVELMKPCPGGHLCAAWREETVVELRAHGRGRQLETVDAQTLPSQNVEFSQFPGESR